MPKPRKTKQAEPEAEVKYPEPYATCYREGGEHGPITVDLAKEWLGWTEDTDHTFAGDFLLHDLNKVKVRCLNNVTNRPLVMPNVQLLKQETLQKRWRLNGETIIIGRTGKVLNGQHSLIALILAEQERVGPDKHHWETNWPGPVTMDKFVVFGIDEADETVNTMDTCKPRTLADVLYRSEHLKKYKLTGTALRTLARITDGAIKFLWLRTGMGSDGFSPKRTHAEALSFLERHPKILTGVKHIYDENDGDVIGRYVSPGVAAGIMYLMATAASDSEEYHVMEEPNEKKLNFSYGDKAGEFFTLLAKSTSLGAVRTAISKLSDPNTLTGARLAEKVAIIAHAWDVFKDGVEPTPGQLKLKYQEDDNGNNHLVDVPTFGGIDLGEKPPKAKKAAGGEGDESDPDDTPDESTPIEDDPADPSPEEIEAAGEEPPVEETTKPTPKPRAKKPKPALRGGTN